MKKQFKVAAILCFCFVQFSNNSSAQSDTEKKIKFFIEGVKTVKKIYDWAVGEFTHNWCVIKYSDGFCIFNRFKGKRTTKDVINHAMGEGDCDWWPWPEGSKHVCLDSEAKAEKLVTQHGRIKEIKWIDHPTAKCGH